MPQLGPGVDACRSGMEEPSSNPGRAALSKGVRVLCVLGQGSPSENMRQKGQENFLQERMNQRILMLLGNTGFPPHCCPDCPLISKATQTSLEIRRGSRRALSSLASLSQRSSVVPARSRWKHRYVMSPCARHVTCPFRPLPVLSSSCWHGLDSPAGGSLCSLAMVSHGAPLPGG